MEPPKPDPNNVPNGTPDGLDEPMHADGSPREDNRWLRSVVENSSESVTIVDPDGTLRYASPAFGRMLGYDPEEVVGTMNVLDHVHPDDLPNVLEMTEKALSEGGTVSNRAEYRFRHKDGSWRWVESIGTHLLDDPIVGGVVVQTRDTTDRKETEERFRAQYKNLPVPTYTWRRVGEDFVLVDHNDAAHEFTGGHITEILGSRATGLLSDRPLLLEMIEHCFEARSSVRQELPWRMLRTGEEKHFVATCVFVPPELVMVHIEDITERVRAEERLRLQARLLGAVGDAVIALDVEGRVVYWNRAAEELYGFSAEEIMGSPLREVVPESLLEQAEDVGAQLREGRSWTGEFVVRRRDGTTFLVEATDTPVFGEDGEQVGLVGVLRDVTERKEAEEALRRSEAEVFSVLESITDAFFALDREWRFTYINSRAEVLFSRKREDLIGERIWEDPNFYPQYQRAVAEGVTARFEAYYPPLEAWYSVRAYPSEVGISVYLQDITDRKRVEVALRESERRFSSVVSNAHAFVYRCLNAPGYPNEYASDYALELTGYEPEELLVGGGVRFGDLIVEADRDKVWAEIQKALAGRTSFRLTYAIRRRDGQIRHVREHGQGIYDEDGRVMALEGLVYDVTELVEAEERLKESEERYRTLVERVPAIAYIHHHKPGEFSGTTYASPQVEIILGYTQEEYTAEPEFWKGIVHPDDRERVHAEDERNGRTGEPFSVEYRMIDKDGSVVWVRESGTLVRIEDDGTQVWHGVMFDITELKQLEGELRDAEERYRTLVEQIPAVTYIDPVDEPETSLYTSPQVEQMLGYTPEEWIEGRLWPKRLHPEDRDRVLTADERFEAGGEESFSEEYRLIAKDGSVVWVHERAVVLKDGTGEPLFWQGVIFDVTERKEAEEGLKESEERYRRRSRELALLHRVRSALAHELDAQGVLYKAVEAVAQAYGYTQVSAYLLEGEELVLQHQVGYERVIERIPVTEGVSGRAVRTRRPVHVEDVSADPDCLGPIEGVRSEICVPLFDESRVVAGTLNVEGTGGTTLTRNDLRLMIAVGEHVGVAVSRAQLHAQMRYSEERYRALTQNSSDLVTLMEATGTIRYQSPAIERMLGYTSEELVGSNVFDYVHPEDLQRVERAFTEGLKLPERHPSVEYRFLHKRGFWRWLESVGTNLLRDPAVSGYVFNSRDVTERRLADIALKESEQRFRGSFENAAIGMALVGLDGRFLRTNKSLCEIVGYSHRELLGKTFQEITHPDDLQKDLEHVERLLTGEVRTYQVEKRYLHKDGHVVWILLSSSAVYDEQDEPLYFISQIQDVSERKRIEEQLKLQALHDPLTGLPNRKVLMDRLNHALERTRRRSGRKVAVLFMDLDGFKVINDSLGHEAGDLLLVVMKQRLQRCLRPEDTLARFGGDEFVVLIEEVENLGDAVRVARRITQEFRRPFVLEDRGLFASASVGIALGDARTKSPEDLLRDADTAMYRAKDEHADYRVFEPGMYEWALGRLELENDLRRAIEAQEFVVHYQPIVDLETGEVCGAEALVRWDHPERGLLDPSEFMPVTEESGLVVPVGERVLEEACLQARRWQEDPRIPSLAISVNLSAVQLRRSDLASTIEETLRKTGLDPSRLSLDITETAYITVIEEKSAVLDRLKDLGVNICIDDFGVGYSSLSYLKRLPADTLKIDKSFVKGLGEDMEDAAIVRMVKDLAHTLGMKVVAEGVESTEQAALVAEIGCDLAQGYYFSRPLPPEEVSEFLAR